MTTTSTSTPTTTAEAHVTPLQPLLHDEVVVLAAPTQAWSDRNGAVGTNPVHGYWTGDQRVVSAVGVSVTGSDLEPVSVAPASAREVVFSALLRGLDARVPTPTSDSTAVAPSGSTACARPLRSRTVSRPRRWGRTAARSRSWSGSRRTRAAWTR